MRRTDWLRDNEVFVIFMIFARVIVGLLYASQAALVRRIGWLRRNTALRTDERVRLAGEVINGALACKMLGWEDAVTAGTQSTSVYVCYSCTVACVVRLSRRLRQRACSAMQLETPRQSVLSLPECSAARHSRDILSTVPTQPAVASDTMSFLSAALRDIRAEKSPPPPRHEPHPLPHTCNQPTLVWFLLCP